MGDHVKNQRVVRMKQKPQLLKHDIQGCRVSVAPNAGEGSQSSHLSLHTRLEIRTYVQSRLLSVLVPDLDHVSPQSKLLPSTTDLRRCLGVLSKKQKTSFPKVPVQNATTQPSFATST